SSFCRCFFFSSRRRHTRFSRDWSSDVCSSDLPAPHHLYHRQPIGPRALPPNPRWHRPEHGAGRAVFLLALAVALFGAWAAFHGEIGRASCRERVEVAVGGGSLNAERQTQNSEQ